MPLDANFDLFDLPDLTLEIVYSNISFADACLLRATCSRARDSVHKYRKRWNFRHPCEMMIFREIGKKLECMVLFNDEQTKVSGVGQLNIDDLFNPIDDVVDAFHRIIHYPTQRYFIRLEEEAQMTGKVERLLHHLPAKFCKNVDMLRVTTSSCNCCSAFDAWDLSFLRKFGKCDAIQILGMKVTSVAKIVPLLRGINALCINEEFKLDEPELVQLHPIIAMASRRKTSPLMDLAFGAKKRVTVDSIIMLLEKARFGPRCNMHFHGVIGDLNLLHRWIMRHSHPAEDGHGNPEPRLKYFKDEPKRIEAFSFTIHYRDRHLYICVISEDSPTTKCPEGSNGKEEVSCPGMGPMGGDGGNEEMDQDHEHGHEHHHDHGEEQGHEQDQDHDQENDHDNGDQQDDEHDNDEGAEQAAHQNHENDGEVAAKRRRIE